MRIAFQDDQSFWRSSAIELLSQAGHAVETFDESQEIPFDPQDGPLFDIVVIDSQLANELPGIDRLIALRRRGFSNPLILYSTLPRIRDKSLAKANNIIVAMKRDLIDDVIENTIRATGLSA